MTVVTIDCGRIIDREEAVDVNQLKKPFGNDESIRRLETVMLRAFVAFDIAQKLLMLAIVELQDAGKKTGWW